MKEKLLTALAMVLVIGSIIVGASHQAWRLCRRLLGS